LNMDVPNEKIARMEEYDVTTTDLDAGGSANKKVRFGNPLDDRSDPTNKTDQPDLNNLAPKKKKIVPILVDTAHPIVNEINVEKKRAAEELVTPIDKSQPRTIVNILVAKKKTKVASRPSTTITTV